MGVNRLIIDVSSLGWTALFDGKDKEFGYEVQFNDRTVNVNSAQHGYENAVNFLLHAMDRFNVAPSDMIFVNEGESPKAFRRQFLPEYSIRDNRAPEQFEEFFKLKDMLFDAFTKIGASIVTQDNVEADDIIAYLVQNLDGHKYILSNDGDMTVLINETTHLLANNKFDENKYGPFDVKYVTVYKALVGDPGDKIPGAKGFGDKAFLDLLVKYDEDGLAAMEDLILKKDLGRLSEDVADFKALQKIIDNADTVYRSYAAAKLYPDRVNTLRKPLVWTVGMVKPDKETTDERLKKYAGQVRLVGADKWVPAVDFFKSKIAETPYFTLDIETTTPDESDDWLRRARGKSDDGKDVGVDVFGSSLVGLSVTFGANRQFTYYIPVKHNGEDGVQNVLSLQVLELIKLIPEDVPHVIQNVSFELTVLYQEWAKHWDNGAWAGFVPSAYDTKIMASYVDENMPKGLKQRSLAVLGYTQETYDEVTSYHGLKSGWDGYGAIMSEEFDEDGRVIVDVKYKMDQLSATHVLSYGADDTICTSALFTHYRTIMELEQTWEVFKEVEIEPAYVTALAYVQGCPLDLQHLKKLEAEDQQIAAQARYTLNKFLIEKGWDGTVLPVYEEITLAAVKQAYLFANGEDFSTRVRTVSKLPPLLEDAGDTVLARIVASNDVAALNTYIKNHFTGEPKINFDSPKQVNKFLYDVLGLPVRVVNKLTPTEREKNPLMAQAVSKFNKIFQGSMSTTMTAEEMELIKPKASTDDTAVDFALAMDADDKQREILTAMVKLKKTLTRQKLYYTPYPYLMHWKDNMLHSSLNQSEAVTRRYTSSGPNLQQLSKKGDGVKVRQVIVPHCKDAVICSIDFSGQELRLMAEQSQDANMLSCYIGDKLKDIHSITASGAMEKKWGKTKVQELVGAYCSHLDSSDSDFVYDVFVTLHKKVDVKEIRKMSDDLRKDAKNVNFAAQFDAQAAKVAQMLIMSVEDAQGFLDAKYKMFPRVETWKDEVRDELMRQGYVTTMMGGRRHLREGVLNPNKWEAERAGRQGPNFKIQGSAAEMTKLAMARLWRSGVLTRLNMRFIAPVHDEIVWSVHKDDAIESIRAVHAAMTGQYAGMKVPVLGSISLGPNFGKQIECGETIDEAVINAAVRESIDSFLPKD